MARIGKKPINKEKSEVNINDNVLKVKNGKHELDLTLPQNISVEIKDDIIEVNSKNDLKETIALQGTYRQLIQNMIIGVTKGYEKILMLEGVGYRAQVNGKKLVLTLGYSHPVEYELPEKVNAEVDGNTKIKLTSIDKQLIGQTAAEIKSFRPPEPYKGKGIKFENEQILRKAGKTGKK